MISLPDPAAKGKACAPGVESLRPTFLDTPKPSGYSPFPGEKREQSPFYNCPEGDFLIL